MDNFVLNLVDLHDVAPPESKGVKTMEGAALPRSARTLRPTS